MKVVSYSTMVTAAQLQLLQSPIAALISTISTSVNVKLDDTNYLNWHFQMRLLLESNGICGFVDGTHPCPMSTSADECETNVHNSPSTMDCDEALVWRMHDRAVMQLITATLSSVSMTCAIGSTCSKDLWNSLKEQFSTVSRTSIFQMKSNLQNIRKGADSITQYLLKIKEARDYLSAAGVFFAEEDIVILALNGLPPEYNTFRCVIRGRENVISLKEFRSQLLAEESIVENLITGTPSYLTAMHTISKPHVSSASSQVIQQSRGSLHIIPLAVVVSNRSIKTEEEDGLITGRDQFSISSKARCMIYHLYVRLLVPEVFALIPLLLVPHVRLYVSCAIWKATLPDSVILRVLTESNVTSVEETITPHGSVFIMKMAPTSMVMEITPQNLVSHCRNRAYRP